MGMIGKMKSLKIILLLITCCWMASSCAQRTELSKKDTSEVQWIKGSKYYVYKVEKGETIYSITKRFNVTEEDLLKNNPDLKAGLKNKMQLLIPAVKSEKKSEGDKKSES